MANNQITQTTSRITETNSMDSFNLFPKLPTELRIKIWKLSFVPHRLVINGAEHRAERNQITGAHLLVNFEARQVFLENYTSCFRNLDQNDQNAVYFNFSIDILCMRSALTGLRELLQLYPDVMNQVQWIDVGPDRHSYSSNVEWSRIDLSSLTSCKQVTLRWNLNTNHQRDYYGGRDESDMDRTFNHLRNALYRKPGPKLAVVYPSYPSRPQVWESRARSDNIYVETSADLTNGSFGNFQTDDWFNEVDVNWIQREQPWATIEATLRDFREATAGEPEPGTYNNPLPMQMQQVAAPAVGDRSLRWFKYMFHCFF